MSRIKFRNILPVTPGRVTDARRASRYVYTLLAALLITACGSPSPEQQLAEAKKLRRQGDAAAAIVLLQNVLKAEPENGEARLILGTIFREHGRRQVAEHHFRAALQANVDPRIVLPLLAQALFEQAEFQKVVEATRSSDFGEAAQQPEVLSYRGHALLSLERPEDAAASFDEALKRKPEFAPALLGYARLALLRQDAPRAAALIDRAIAADSSSIDAWLLKGDIEKALRNGDAAMAAYRKALDLKPDGLAANLNLASMHMDRGEFDAARKRIDTVLRVAPDAAAGSYLLGLLEFQSGNYVAAGEAVQRVLRIAPGYVPALALSGAVAYATGDNEIAERRLGSAVSSYQGGSVYLRKLYAAALLKSGKVPQAARELEAVLSIAPGDPAALAMYAGAKYHSQEIAVARKYFELALKQQPRSAEMRAGLGLARLAAGETDRALDDLEAAVDLGGASADGYLVATLISLRQYEKALQAIARLETTRPKDPVTYNLKGSALFATGDTSAARQAFERALELDPSQVAAAVNLAQLDVREGNAPAAQKRFEKMLERDPKSVPVLLALSDLAAALGDRAEALRWAKSASQLSPKALAPALAMSRLYIAEGDYANAAPAAYIALKASPGNAEALDMLAQSQLLLGQRTLALDTFQAFVNWHPNSAHAHYGLARAQIADSQFFAAQRSLQKALELRPNFPEGITALSDVQLRLGRTDEARKTAVQTQARLPKAALGFVIAGDVAMAENRVDQAIRAYEAAFDAEKSSSTLIKLLGALRAGGKDAAADALTATWLKSNPGDLDILYVTADSAIRRKDFLTAAEQYRTALGLQPKKLEVLHNLGWVYERLNDPRALEVAESAYRIAPTDPGVLHTLGRLLITKGDAASAMSLLEKARLAAPESQHIRYQLALAYVATGGNSLARAELKQLLRGQQEFPEREAAMELLKKLER